MRRALEIYSKTSTPASTSSRLDAPRGHLCPDHRSRRRGHQSERFQSGTVELHPDSYMISAASISQRLLAAARCPRTVVYRFGTHVIRRPLRSFSSTSTHAAAPPIGHPGMRFITCRAPSTSAAISVFAMIVLPNVLRSPTRAGCASGVTGGKTSTTGFAKATGSGVSHHGYERRTSASPNRLLFLPSSRSKTGISSSNAWPGSLLPLSRPPACYNTVRSLWSVVVDGSSQAICAFYQESQSDEKS
ncbi:hypothetical protein B0H12DRAFT_1240376 [Mycena haematopus]|nr:hypothetical protein B0H12DRAFT_1240376 [Mycena haematopus]